MPEGSIICPTGQTSFKNPTFVMADTCGAFGGAAGQIRTADLVITNDALYRLSYSSTSFRTAVLLYHKREKCQAIRKDFFKMRENFSFRPNYRAPQTFKAAEQKRLRAGCKDLQPARECLKSAYSSSNAPV